MTECQGYKCGAKATLYLCPLCQTELRRALLRLPSMIEDLKDSAIGNTRLSSESSRQLGFESRQPIFNTKATDLVTAIGDTVGGWARGTARMYGLMISPPVTWHRPWDLYVHTAADYAMFLAANVARLAKDPDVGELCASLRGFVKRAHTIMDHPVPSQFCGPCPTWVTDHRLCGPKCGLRSHQCAKTLLAPHGASEVYCGACQVTHSVEKLVNRLLSQAGNYRGTLQEIYQVLRMLGTPVKLRTLEYWASPKIRRLRPAGYLRADGRRIGVSRQDKTDTPVYRISDARSVSAEHKPGRGNHVRTEAMREKTRQSVKQSKSEGRKQK